MTRRLLLLCALACAGDSLLTGPAALAGQATGFTRPTVAARPLDRYGVDVWDASSGLLPSRIRAIAQTPDGYLWLATDNGLLRFDGVTFTTFGIHTGSVRDNEVGALAPDGDGGLWIGTYGGGLTHMSHGRFVTYTMADGLPDDDVRLVDRGPDGSIWFTTRRGLGRFTNGTFQRFTTQDGLPAAALTALCARSAEGVFVGTFSTVYRFEAGRFGAVGALAEATRYGDVNAMAPATDGSLLVLVTHALARLSRGSVSVQAFASSPNTNGRVIYQDPSGAVWMGAREGLFRVAGAQLESLPSWGTESRMGVIYSMLTDREGSLWVGLESNGLARLRPSQIDWIGAERGLPDIRARAVLQDRAGTTWIGTSQGLVAMRQGHADPVPAPGTTRVLDVSALEEGRDGGLWVGSLFKLYRLQQGRLVPHPAWSDRGSIRRLYQDPRGPMWVGTDGNGLFRVDGGVVEQHPATASGACARIRDVLRDRRGDLWVATSGCGVLRMTDAGATTYTKKDGLGSDYALDIFEDDRGTIWVGTRSGLGCFRNGRFVTFTAEHGFFCTFVHAVQQDASGDYWFSCVQGIFTIGKSDMQRLADGTTSRVTSRHFGIAEGMRSLSCAAGTFPTVARTSDGRLLVCTFRGVAVVDPADRLVNLQPPPVNIEAVRVDGQGVDAANPRPIPPGHGDVEVHFSAATFLGQDAVRYKYRLEGYSPDWVDAGSRRTAYYTGLPPGDYRFQVVACNNSQVWNMAGAAVRLTLQPHFYQTTWFLLACVGAVALGGVGAHRWRVRRLVAMEQTLTQRVAEALAKVKVLSGLLPICAQCKKIRDDKGYWNSLERYISAHSESRFSHGICPDCARLLYPELTDLPSSGDALDENPPGSNPA